MTLYKFNINHICEKEKCAELIQSKIYVYLKQEILEDGHISISHKPNDHTIWLFLYDNPLKHESESEGKVIIQDSEIIKKWIGKTPILSELKLLF